VSQKRAERSIKANFAEHAGTQTQKTCKQHTLEDDEAHKEADKEGAAKKTEGYCRHVCACPRRFPFPRDLCECKKTHVNNNLNALCIVHNVMLQASLSLVLNGKYHTHTQLRGHLQLRCRLQIAQNAEHDTLGFPDSCVFLNTYMFSDMAICSCFHVCAKRCVAL
jgi:hypothetical protein